MKDRIRNSILFAAQWFLLMSGLILAGVSILIGHIAMTGGAPMWHPLVTALASIVSLTAGAYIANF